MNFGNGLKMHLGLATKSDQEEVRVKHASI